MNTFRDLVERERLSKGQALTVNDGIRWANRFGLLQHLKWFDLDDVRTALVLSVIVEEARSTT